MPQFAVICTQQYKYNILLQKFINKLSFLKKLQKFIHYTLLLGYSYYTVYFTKVSARKADRYAHFKHSVINAGVRRVLRVLYLLQREVRCDNQRLFASVSAVYHIINLLKNRIPSLTPCRNRQGVAADGHTALLCTHSCLLHHK